MSTHNDLTLALDVDLREDTLMALTTAVDQLDDLHVILDGVLFVPAQDRTLEEYVEKAIRYLVYLYERLREDDLRQVSTAPLEEVMTRQRITRVLRSGVGEMQS